jgi:hypothetical protein
MALLSQHNMSHVIPDYYPKLKRALKTILLFSMLSTTILLPDVIMVLGLMTWLLIVFLFLVMTYIQPKVWIAFSALWLAIVFSPFDLTLAQANYWLFQVAAYLLPLVGFISYQMVERLDKFKMSEEVKLRFSAYSGLSIANSFNSIEKIPEKSRPKFQQWLIDNNLMVFRKLLRSNEKVSKLTLVDIAASGVTRFGKSSFFTWSIVIVLFCCYQQFYPLSNKTADSFYMMFFAMFSVGIVAMGSIMSFFAFNERKEYLARLRLMPLFSNEQEFTRLILRVFFINQGKLLLFTLVSCTVIILMVWPDSAELLLNTLVINIVSFCLFSAVTLFGWHTRKQVKLIVMVLMMLFLILLIPTAMISYDQHFLLTTSDTFNSVMLTGFALLLVALLNWLFKAPSWQKLS